MIKFKFCLLSIKNVDKNDIPLRFDPPDLYKKYVRVRPASTHHEDSLCAPRGPGPGQC